MKRYGELRHSEEGLASIALQGDHFCITLGRALGLDDTHQVGRRRRRRQAHTCPAPSAQGGLRA